MVRPVVKGRPMTDDDDLFAVRPAKPARRPPVQKREDYSAPIPERPANYAKAIPARAVASFSCVCDAQDEVLEPAPERVDCWACRKWQGMKRFDPGYDPPVISARKLTDEERARML